MSRKPRRNAPTATLHVYTRVSTAQQRDDGTSLQTQLEQGQQRAKQLGLAVKHWDEGGRSSHHEEIADRPTLAALYQAIKNGDVKHLFVYDQSRLSRNDNVASIFRYECNKQGVTLYTKDGQFDLANPQDRFLKQILDGLSEFDNAMRAERTRLGKLNRTRSGFWHGGPPPFGYRVVDKRLEIEPKEARWVKKIFTHGFKGTSPRDIKVLLDTNGVPPRRGGSWTIGSIQALWKNTHYAGNYQVRDRKSEVTIKVTCPVIVDPDIWHAVQLRRKRKTNRAQQQNATTRHFYLLRDIMQCGHCGRAITGRQRPTKYEQFYFCPNKQRIWAKEGGSKTPWARGKGCGMTRSLNIRDSDAVVFKAVHDTHRASRLLREEVRSRVIGAKAAAIEATAKKTVELTAKVKRLDKRIAETQAIIGGMQGTYEIGKIPRKMYEARRKVLEEEMRSLEQESVNLKLMLKNDATQKRWRSWMDRFGDEIDEKTELSDVDRKAYIEGLLDRIEVRYNKKADEHELTLQFRLPVVEDKIHQKKAGTWKAGYDLEPGRKDLIIRIPRKTHVPQGKGHTP